MRSNIIVRKILVEVDKEKKDMFKTQQQSHKLLAKIPIQLSSYDVYMRIVKKQKSVKKLFINSRNSIHTIFISAAVMYAIITFPKTLKYCTGVQQDQSYVMGRKCLFSLGQRPFQWCQDKNALCSKCFTSASFAPHLFLLAWLKLNLAFLLDQLRLAYGDERW